MERIRSMLRSQEFPRADELDERVLYPGDTRFDALEWSVSRMVGSRCAKHLELGAPAADEETRVKRLQDTLNLLGLQATTESIRGEGSRADKLEFLNRLLRMTCGALAISHNSSIPQAESNLSLLDSACGMAASLFLATADVLPPDVKKAADTFKGEGLDSVQMQEAIKAARSQAEEIDKTLQTGVCTSSAGGKWRDAETELSAQLVRFHEAAAKFSSMFAEDLTSWAGAISEPEVYGIGPASTRIMHKYHRLKELLDGASAIHGSYDSMSSELQDDVQKQQWLEAMVQQKCSARERLGLQSALVQDGPFAAPSRLRASTLY